MTIDYEELAASQGWLDFWRYSPAARHRRRLIKNILRSISFESLLDVGCGQGLLLMELSKDFKGRLAGCDLSAKAVRAASTDREDLQFWQLDVEVEPLSERFDVVVCTEVIEHVPNWQRAVQNVAAMSRRYVLLTVPSSPLFDTDRQMGHLRHFDGPELEETLSSAGFRTSILWRWGFPFHTIYKHAINGLAPHHVQQAFASAKYSLFQRCVSLAIDWVFYLNGRNLGYQLVLLAERRSE